MVCAAAEAMGAAPPAVRPVLLVAFRRAREVGLNVEEVERALSEVVEKGGAKSKSLGEREEAPPTASESGKRGRS